MTKLSVTLGLLSMLSGVSLAAQHPAMPPGISHEDHLRQMEKDEALKHRGAIAMGFDQDKTVHHFLLQPTGGEIEVTAKNPADAESITQIRSHLREIANAFSDGAFEKPEATHGELPPGSATISANRALIRYRYEERTNGASVVIDTTDDGTRRAIHDFLRYQIVEHKTGDPLSPRQ